MTAPNRTRGARFERYEYRAAPTFDEPRAEAVRRWRGNRDAGLAVREDLHDSLHESTRFLQFIESHGDPGSDIAVRPDDLGRRELRVRCARQIDARIE